MSAWSSALDGLRAQWATQPRLRVGVALACLVAWVHGMVLVLDQAEADRRQAAELREQLAVRQALAQQAGLWPRRLQELRQAQDAVHALMWHEPERGMAEASMQDMMLALANKSSLRVREQAMLQPEVWASARPSRAEGEPAPAAAQPGEWVLPAGYAPMRLRLVAEFSPRPVASMLAELAQADRLLRVERLRIATTSQPPLFELEATGVVRLAPRSPP